MAEMISNTKIHSKSTTIEELNDEQLIEILHRVPLPFLLQCKSVNKLFFRVISDPHFFHPRLIPPRASQDHTLFHLLFHCFNGKNNVLFFLDSNNKIHILDNSYFLPCFWHQGHNRDRFRVKATHHDLVLCSTRDNSYNYYFVCNPFTKQHVVLPPLAKIHAHESACVGFIYDQCRSRFRVTHIPVVQFAEVSRFQVHVFLSETGEWRVSNVDGTFLMPDMHTNGVVYKGMLVWWIEERGFLVCFDPFDGWDSNWRIVDNHFPLFYTSRRWSVHTGLCNGRFNMCLLNRTHLVSLLYDADFITTAQWWFQYHFDLSYAFWAPQLTEGFPMTNKNFLAFHPQCEHLIYLYSNKSIFLFDSKRNKLESLYTVADHEVLQPLGNVMFLVLPEWPTPIPV